MIMDPKFNEKCADDFINRLRAEIHSAAIRSASKIRIQGRNILLQKDFEDAIRTIEDEFIKSFIK